MTVKKGQRFGGRQKGTPNKLTASVKHAIEKAFKSVGGEKYLAQVAKDDPRTFCALLGRVLPTQLTGENEGPIEIKAIVEYVDADPRPD